MGTIYYKDKEGKEIPYEVAGDSPTPYEEDWILQDLGYKKPKPSIAGAFAEGVGTTDEQIKQFAGGIGAAAAEKLPSVFGDPKGWWDYVDEQKRQIAEEGWVPESGITDSETWGDSLRALAYTAGQSIAPTVGGAAAMLAAGPAAGLGIATALAVPQAFNENVEAQREGDGQVDNWAKVALGTGANAVIESVTDRILLGAGAALGTVGKDVVAEAAASGVKKAIQKLGYIAPGALKTGAIGAAQGSIEETLQTAITRLQAEMPMMDDAAKAQYIESAVAGAVLEGAYGAVAGAGGGYIDKRINQQKDQNKLAAEDYSQYVARMSSEYKADIGKSSAYFNKAVTENFDEEAFKAAPELPTQSSDIISAAEYLTAERAIQSTPKISKTKLRELVGSSKKGDALIDLLTQRGALVKTKDGKFFKASAPALQDYVVAKVWEKPSYNLESSTHNESFETRDAAEKAAKKMGIKDYEITEFKPDRKFGVYEVLTNDKGAMVGKRLIESHNTEQSAAESIKEIDPLYSGKNRGNSFYARKVDGIVQRDIDSLAGGLAATVNKILGENKLRTGVVGKQEQLADFGVAYNPENLVEGAATVPGDGSSPALVAATNFIDPGATLETKQEFINSIGHHEVVHQLRNLGMLSKNEWDALAKMARTRFKPDKKYTYMDFARQAPASLLGDGNQKSMELYAEEEAVAEMLRDFAKNPNHFTARQRSLLQKMIDFILRGIGIKRTDRGYEVMENILEGGLASREIGSMAPTRLNGIGSAMFSRVPVAPFYMKSAKALENIPMKKGNALQWESALKKQGVKNEEIDSLTLTEIKGIITKEELGDHIKAHNLVIEEVWDSSIGDEKIVSLEEKVQQVRLEVGDAIKKLENKYIEKGVKPLPTDIYNEEDARAIHIMLMDWFTENNNGTISEAQFYTDLNDVLDGPVYSLIELEGELMFEGSTDEDGQFGKLEYESMTLPGSRDDYMIVKFNLPSAVEGFNVDQHFDYNTIMHTRLTKRTIGDKRVLVVEELQSDVMSEGVKKGYLDEAGRAAYHKAMSDYNKKEHEVGEAIGGLHGHEVDYLLEKFNSSRMYQPNELATNPAITTAFGSRFYDKTGRLPDANDVKLFWELYDLKEVKANEHIKLRDMVSPKPPLTQSWETYVFKRLIRYAAEEDMDGITWPGSKEAVARIEWGGVPVKEAVDAKGVKQYTIENWRGEGQNVTPIVSLYTDKLVNIARKIGQKFNASPVFSPKFREKMGQLDDEEVFALYDTWTLPITEQLKDHAMFTGFEMYSAIKNIRTDTPAYQGHPIKDPVIDLVTEIDSLDGPDRTSTPEFKKWFGNSKVVDERGRPVIAFHGSQSSFDYFARGPRRSAGGLTNPEMDAHFFSSSPDVASDYADAKIYGEQPWRKGEFIEKGLAPNVVPAYLSLQNPLVLDAAGGSWWNTSDKIPPLYQAYKDYVKWLTTANILTNKDASLPPFYNILDKDIKDGVIIKNSLDNFKNDRGEPADVYVAFDSRQIKSKYNIGTFDPNKLNIRYSAIPAGQFMKTAMKQQYMRGDNQIVRQMIAKAKLYDKGLTSYGEQLQGDEPTNAPQYVVYKNSKGAVTPIVGLLTNPATGKKEPAIVQVGGEWYRRGSQWPVGYGVKHAQWHFRHISKDLGTDRPLTEILKAIQSSPEMQRVGEDRGIFTIRKPEWKKPLHVVMQRVKAPTTIGSMKEGDTIWRLVTAFTDVGKDFSMYSAVPNARYMATATPGTRVPNPTPDAMERYYASLTYDNLSRKLHDWTKFLPSSWNDRKSYVIKRGIELFQDRFLSIAEMVDMVRKNGVITAFSDVYREQALTAGKIDTAVLVAKQELFMPFYEKVQALGIDKASIDNLLANTPEFDATRISVGQQLGWSQDVMRDETIHAARRMAKHYKNHNQLATEMYMYALHAKEANEVAKARNRIRKKDAQGNWVYSQNPDRLEQSTYGSGMTDTEAEQILDWARSQPWAAKMAEVEKLYKNIIRATNEVRIAGQIGLDFSIATDQDGNPIRQYAHYAPLKGWLEDETLADMFETDDIFARAGKGYSIRGKEDFSRTGRTSLAVGLIENAMLQHMEAIIRVHKNKLGLTFKNLIEDNERLLEDTAVIMHRTPVKPYYNAKTGLVQMKSDIALSDEFLWVKELDHDENGQPFIRAIGIMIKDARVKRALTDKAAIGNAGMNAATRFMLGINRFLSSTRTSWNPNYIIPNLVRDIQTANISLSDFEAEGLARQVVSKLPNSFKQARAWLKDKNDPIAVDMAEFARYGGKTAVEGIRTVAETVQSIQSGFDAQFEAKGWKDKSGLKAMKKVADYVDGLNDAVENMTRVSVYSTTRDFLLSKSRDPNNPAEIENIRNAAAFAARNATVDFNRGGELKSFMNAYSLFFNASMQGTMTLTNVLIRSKRARKIFATAIMAGFVQDILNSLVSDDDEYDKISDYVLEHNVVMLNPLSEKGYVSIPIPYFFNSFYNTGRTLSRYLRGGYSGGEAMNTIMGTFFDGINPLGGNNFLNFLTPTIADPFIDLAMNENFQGSPIFPEANPFGVDERASMRYFNSTSPIYTGISSFLANLPLIGGEGNYVEGLVEIEPNVLEYLFEYMFSGTLTFGTQIMDLANPFSEKGDIATRLLSGEAWNPQEVPVVRRFLGRISELEDMNAYMENRDRIIRIEKSLKAAQEAGDSYSVETLQLQYPEELAAANAIKKIETRRKKISAAINDIRDSKTMSDSQKSDAIRALRKEQEELVKVANKYFSAL